MNAIQEQYGFKVGQRVLVGDYANGVIVALEENGVVYKVASSEKDEVGSLAREQYQFIYAEDSDASDCVGGFRS